MKKASHVSYIEHQREIKRLSFLEGTVISSELMGRGTFNNLTLRLKHRELSEQEAKALNLNYQDLQEKETLFWIRGSYRIDVGERIRVHYSGSSTPLVVEAFEIISEDGNVKYRYHGDNYEFIDD